MQRHNKLNEEVAMDVERNQPSDAATEMTWLKRGKYGVFLRAALHHKKNVYKGKRFFDQYQWQDVAIKVVQRRHEHERETAFIGVLQHPNIVSVFDSGTYKGLFDWTYIVMELCHQDLDHYVTDNIGKQINPSRCLSFTKQILKGLDYLHGVEIVHLDLKPANILIDLPGQNVKIADFGVSQQLEGGDATKPATSVGYGSDEFKAPEYLRRESHLSYPADVFSFGIVTCYIYSQGRHPFGDICYRWVENIIDDKNMDLTIIPKILTPPTGSRDQLISLLKNALKHEARDRPTTASLIRHRFFLGETPRTMSICQSPFGNPQNAEESNSVDAALKAALSEILSKQGNMDGSIQKVKDLILSKGPKSAQGIRNMADEYNKGDLKQKIQSLILYQISYDVYQQESHEPNETVEWIMRLVKDIRLAAYDLAEKTDVRRKIAMRFGIVFTSSLLNSIRGISDASQSVKTLAEAECLWHIGNVYFRVGSYRICIDFLDKASQWYTKHYKKAVHEIDHYCISLWIIGNCYYRMDDFHNAEEYYGKFVSEVEKTDEISEQWLKIGNDDLTRSRGKCMQQGWNRRSKNS